jgi:hypothetical protein
MIGFKGGGLMVKSSSTTLMLGPTFSGSAFTFTGSRGNALGPQLAVALLSKSMASCVVNGLGLSTLLPVTVIVGSVVTSDPPVVPVAPGVLGVVCVD